MSPWYQSLTCLCKYAEVNQYALVMDITMVGLHLKYMLTWIFWGHIFLLLSFFLFFFLCCCCCCCCCCFSGRLVMFFLVYYCIFAAYSSLKTNGYSKDWYLPGKYFEVFGNSQKSLAIIQFSKIFNTLKSCLVIETSKYMFISTVARVQLTKWRKHRRLMKSL